MTDEEFIQMGHFANDIALISQKRGIRLSIEEVNSSLIEVELTADLEHKRTYQETVYLERDDDSGLVEHEEFIQGVSKFEERVRGLK